MQKKRVWITSAAATAALAVGGASVAVATGGVSDDDDDKALTGQTLEKVTQAALAEVGQGTVAEAEASDGGKSAYEVEVVLDKGGEVDVELNDSYEVVSVSEPETEDDGKEDDEKEDDGKEDDEKEDSSGPPLSEADKAKAEEAALNETGGGTVAEIERSDDADVAYEVDVTLDNSDEVEVALDKDFQPVKTDTEQDD